MEGTEAARASEARHRLANIQQLLSALARLRAQKAEDPETARQLLWLADAVNLLGALERRRVGDLVDFAGFLNEMAPVWRSRRAERAAEIVVDVADFAASDNVASTLALITQELVSNALAHAAATRACTVRISVMREGDRCELCVRDDGPGFGAAGLQERFGLWLVRSLTAQVRGQFSIDAEAGVAARLSFPA